MQTNSTEDNLDALTTEGSRRRWHTLFQVLLFWVGFLLALYLPRLWMGILPPAFQKLSWGVFVSIGSILLTIGFARIHRTPPAELGLSPTRWSFLKIAVGFIAGFGIVLSQIAVVACVMGLHFSIDSRATVGSIVITLLTLFSTATMEELGFRGYPLRRLVGPFGLWSGQLIVAVAFALYHHYCYGWDWTRSLIGTGLGSLLFGMAAIASDGLALPIGIHTGIIFALWAIATDTNPGIWKISIGNPSPHGLLAQTGNASYVASFLIATFLLWLWYRAGLRSTTSARSSRDQAAA